MKKEYYGPVAASTGALVLNDPGFLIQCSKKIRVSPPPHHQLRLRPGNFPKLHPLTKTEVNMSLIMIATEFGIDIKVDPAQPAAVLTCLSYPYTLDLCLRAQELNLDLDKVFAFRGIEDPSTRHRLSEAIEHLRQHEFPSMAQQMAIAHYIVADKFREQPLWLHSFKTYDNQQTAFYFGPAAAGVSSEKTIGCPRWIGLEGQQRLWNSLQPKVVEVAIGPKSDQGYIGLPGITRWLDAIGRMNILLATNYVFKLLQNQPTLPSINRRIASRGDDGKKLLP